MKKLVSVLSILSFLLLIPSKVLAEDTVTICTQSYGGGVVCGVHTPVNTGVADNIALIGAGLILASGVLFYISKKFNRSEI